MPAPALFFYTGGGSGEPAKWFPWTIANLLGCRTGIPTIALFAFQLHCTSFFKMLFHCSMALLWRFHGLHAFFFECRLPNYETPNPFRLITCSPMTFSPPNCGILLPALHSFHSLHSERTFQGIVLITTEAGPTEPDRAFLLPEATLPQGSRRCKLATCTAELSRGVGPAGVLRGIGGTELSKHPTRCHCERP